MTFTPTDSTDFGIATGSTSLNVTQAAVSLSWSAPAAITYGTALSGAQLNASATYKGVAVPGTFAYSPSMGAVLTAGTQILTVTFTPSNTTSYPTVTGSVSLTVTGASFPCLAEPGADRLWHGPFGRPA